MNQVELTALLKVVRAVDRARPVAVHCDSRYLIDANARWLPGWRLGWACAGKA